MKKTKLIILATLIGLFVSLLAVNIAQAQNEECGAFDLCYRPNVKIPIKVQVPGGPLYDFSVDNKIEGGSFLAAYIVAIYKYGAGFAGIVAMFILVIAGWRWLMAGGNAQKISASKDMVNGVLIGLALLFGGQLLLRQISEDFNSIQSLSITLPDGVTDKVQLSKKEKQYCEGIIDSDGKTIVYNTDEKPKEISKCEDYDKRERCEADTCNLIGPGNFDDTCISDFKPGIVPPEFVKCTDCPWRPIGANCSCGFYKDVLIRGKDPCDCDEDGLGGDVPETAIGCCTAGDKNNNKICDDIDPELKYDSTSSSYKYSAPLGGGGGGLNSKN